MATTGGSYEERPGALARNRGARRPPWLTAQQGQSSETKPFYLTSEFLVFVLYLMGLGISASTDETIDARLFWILATVAVFGYMVSRGIAKAATRSRAHDPREDIDLGGD
jgi:quinol-cytochrome oxidoreductase complex cytochrome b subunit